MSSPIVLPPAIDRDTLAADYVAAYDTPLADTASALRFIASRFPALAHLPRPEVRHLGRLTAEATHPLADALIAALWALECEGLDEHDMADAVLVLGAIARTYADPLELAAAADEPDCWWFLAEVAQCWLQPASLAAYGAANPSAVGAVVEDFYLGTGRMLDDPVDQGAQAWTHHAADLAERLLAAAVAELADVIAEAD